MRITYDDFIKYLNILKFGVSKDEIPPYANYIYSTGDTLQSCNDNVFVKLYLKFPFVGAINFFLVEGFIKQFKDGIFNINIVDDKLVIECTSNSRLELNILDMKFPKVAIQQDSDKLLITEELNYIIKLAAKFTGLIKKSGIELYSHVYIGNNCITGTDSMRIVYKKYEALGDIETLLDRQICMLLDQDYKIYRSSSNVVVEFPDNLGEAIFTSSINYMITTYPIVKIHSFVEENFSDIKLCSMSYLADAIKKVSPALFKEMNQSISLHNKNNEITVKVQSMLFGNAITIIPSSLEKEVYFNINPALLHNIPLDYDLYISRSVNIKYIYLCDVTGTPIIIPTKIKEY